MWMQSPLYSKARVAVEKEQVAFVSYLTSIHDNGINCAQRFLGMKKEGIHANVYSAGDRSPRAMGLNVLIAEPHEVRRVGLRTVFLQDARVSNVYEAADDESLKAQLHCCHLDLVVINQSLITEITALPRKNFVILAAESDMAVLRAAYGHNARGYLSVNVSAELLRTMLHPAENSFLIEPTLVPWFLEQI